MDAGYGEAEAEELLAERRPPEQLFEVWEENWQAAQLFMRMQTQWHRVAGFAGERRTGLMYSEMFNVMDRMRVKRQRQLELWGDLQEMEFAALNAIAEADGG